jgi:S1-C subfamily serine protease
MKLCHSLAALAIFIASTTAAFTQQSVYSVAGLSLGERVQFDSKTYRQYECNPSEQFDGFTWCQSKKDEREKRGPFKASYSILHSRDGTAVYINRFQEPAYWADDEVEQDIKRYSRQIKAEPKIIKVPSRRGLPEATIAVWGKVVLEPLDNESRQILAADKNVKRGILIDAIGNYNRSAREDLPLFRLTGGPGFVWIGSNKNGRGILRILAINPSKIYPTVSQPPPPPPQSRTPDDNTPVTIGSWTIRYRVAGDINGCEANSHFRDQTTFGLSLVQLTESDRRWLIFISNPNWNHWIRRKHQHTLPFITTKKWQVNFEVNDSNFLWTGDLSTDFVNSIADAASIEIMNERNEILVSLDMTDSAAAIRAVVNCVRNHPYVVAAPKQRPAPPSAPVPERESVFTGTGFFVATNRLVTNNHVVKECRRGVEIRFADQPSRPAYVLSQDDINDLALLHTDITSPLVAWFRLRPRVGERVATYGFPYSGILSSSGNFTLGDVSASTGMGDDSRILQISVPVQPGNSGGPLVDMIGNVVGMVTAQLSAFAMIPSGSIPQNVNFAIRSPIITNFLSVKGVSAKVSDSDSTGVQDLPAADVADIAKQFTVQIHCKGVSGTSGRGGASHDLPMGWR